MFQQVRADLGTLHQDQAKCLSNVKGSQVQILSARPASLQVRACHSLPPDRPERATVTERSQTHRQRPQRSHTRGYTPQPPTRAVTE